MLSNRCGKSSFNRPVIGTVVQSHLVYANFICPLGYGHCFTFEGVKSVAPSIIGLLSSSGPLAVLGGVRSIIVNTFKSMFGARSWSHVSVEGRKVIPPWVNRYASAAVVVIGRIVGVSAPSAHVNPSGVFRDTLQAMRARLLSWCLSLETSTTLGIPSVEIRSTYNSLISAVALAEPHDTPAPIWSTLNDNQSPISKSSSVNQSHVTSKMKAALGRCKMLSRNLRQGAAAFRFMIAPYKSRDKCILA